MCPAFGEARDSSASPSPAPKPASCCCMRNRGATRRMSASKLPRAALIGPQRVVDFPRPVDADGDGKAEILEEAPVVLGEQGAVGGDREADVRAAGVSEFASAAGSAACKTARLTSGSPPRNARLRRAPGFRRADQQLDRAQRLVQSHVLRRCRRTRPAGRSNRRSRDCTSGRWRAKARGSVGGAAAHRRLEGGRRARPAAAARRSRRLCRAPSPPRSVRRGPARRRTAGFRRRRRLMAARSRFRSGAPAASSAPTALIERRASARLTLSPVSAARPVRRSATSAPSPNLVKSSSYMTSRMSA